ncbi:hypothetical protein [Pseudomonas sp. B21-053]|uniref:hypothetical protein n=1 Tax=Pseudomonas sp. B21-053 TaxID=2895493 RepID=UPI002231CF03|nr:hypothetical protein [Pseudomonas sp. B21-053]UZE12972.1 hypothetical protein LOY68_05015 [Pseudomonas sp. B21-053]
MKAFGVGCFHFSIKDSTEHEISVKDYIDEIVKTLQKLTTASDVSISFDESIKYEKINTTPPNPRINDGEQCYPTIPFLNLTYKIYIPSRIQAELIGIPERNLDTGTENFKITIRHEWHGPVSYVECLSATEDTRPSTAVQVVREYLKKEIQKLETFLEYDFLGPSPFHANFYLNKAEIETEKKSEDAAFTLNETKTPGYNILNFKYDPHEFGSENEALEELQETLADELSFFYELNKEAYSSFKKWMEIQETTHAILDYEEKKNNKNAIKKIIEKPKLFRKAFKDIGLFKGHLIFMKGQTERNYASVYKSGKRDTYLQEYVDQELSEHSEYPLNETSELIKYFDQKNSKTIELLTILSAGILGGIVGSTITTAFGS